MTSDWYVIQLQGMLEFWRSALLQGMEWVNHGTSQTIPLDLFILYYAISDPVAFRK
jgi:hypothetical protein